MTRSPNSTHTGILDLPREVLWQIAGVGQEFSADAPYLHLETIGRLRCTCRTLRAALPTSMIISTATRCLDFLPTNNEQMERLEAEIRRRCRLRAGLSDEDEDEDEDEIMEGEVVRRRPPHYECCPHPAKHAVGVLLRALGRAQLKTALQTGDVDFVKAVIRLFGNPGYEKAVSSWQPSYYTYVSEAAKAGQLGLALYLWDHAKLFCQTTEPPMRVEAMIGKILREAAAAGMPALCQKCVEFASVEVLQALNGNRRYSPLYYAAKNQNMDTVAYLVDNAVLNGADLTSGVVGASESGALDVLEYLIGRGADVNGSVRVWREDDNDENFDITPLMNAAANGKLEAVKLLLAHEADVNAQVGPTSVASDFIYEEARYATTALCVAARNGHGDICKDLLDAGADPHRNTDLAIHLASYYGHVDVVRMFLDAGVAADVPRGEAFPFGTATPLYHACRGSHPAVVRLLRTRGALITHVALVTAIGKPDEAVSAAILDRNAPEFSMRDIYASSTYPPASVSAQESPLARAVQCGKWSLFWELLSCYGADVTREGYAALLAALAGFAGLHTAKEREPPRVIIEFLLDSGKLFKEPSPQLEAFSKNYRITDSMPDAIARPIRDGLEAMRLERRGMTDSVPLIARPFSGEFKAVPAKPYDPKDGFRFSF
ncbi:hypothetical protein HDU86_001289 [Geranomyces michiganensis]|nr:hypothetical protein HDU86_001289 [Geranomyces michiganensis]